MFTNGGQDAPNQVKKASNPEICLKSSGDGAYWLHLKPQGAAGPGSCASTGPLGFFRFLAHKAPEGYSLRLEFDRSSLIGYIFKAKSSGEVVQCVRREVGLCSAR